MELEFEEILRRLRSRRPHGLTEAGVSKLAVALGVSRGWNDETIKSRRPVAWPHPVLLEEALAENPLEKGERLELHEDVEWPGDLCVVAVVPADR